MPGGFALNKSAAVPMNDLILYFFLHLVMELNLMLSHREMDYWLFETNIHLF